MSWFERIVPSRIKTERRTRSVPEGLWTKCPACDAVLYRAEIERNLHVCPKCSHHMRINGRERLAKFLDTGSTTELAAKVEAEDPLKFKDSKRYKDRLVQAQKQTGERDALIVMAGKLADLDVVAVAFEFRFLGGSWDRWWARNSRAPSNTVWSIACRWCASRQAAAPACRRRCTRCCRWPRPARH